MLEWEIDLKLLHLEKRKNANKPYPKWDDKTVKKCNESRVSEHNNEIFKAGGYISPKGYCVDIPADDPMLQATKIYSQEFNVNDVDRDYYFDDNYKRIVRQETPISVENEDCFVVARKMCRNSKAVVISLVKDEALSMRSNYSLLLMQNSGAFPLYMNFGGIYSPEVTVFRKGEKDFYNLMDEVHKLNIIMVESPDGGLTQEGLAIMKNKIRTIYRIALSNNHRELGTFSVRHSIFRKMKSSICLRRFCGNRSFVANSVKSILPYLVR